MTQKKISRKKLLKEPDEFITTTQKIFQFVRDHRQRLIHYGIIVGGVAVIAGGAYTYFYWQEGKSRKIQGEGFQLYQEAFAQGGTPGGEKENYRKALEKFQKALAVYGRGDTAQFSLICMANCYYYLKEYDQAITTYNRLLEGPYRSMALNGLGYSYEAKGNYSQALEYYQKKQEGASPSYPLENLLDMARCYEALNQKQKALEIYQKAAAQNAKSQSADFIQWKISELRG